MSDTANRETKAVRAVGFLCIQGYPRRICSGCTSACSERVYVEAEPDNGR